MLTVPYIRRRIVLHVKNRIVGGTPTNPKLIEGWLKANMPEVTEDERAKLAATTLEQVKDVVEEESKAMWTTFKKDVTGVLFIEGRQVKAAFKEAANILREALIKQDKKGKPDEKKNRFTGFKSKLAERLFVEEERIFLIRPGIGPVTKPSGTEERPIHVMTAMGERTALKRYDYVSDVDLTFTVRWLDDGLMDDELLTVLLDYMGWNGLGADRSQGEGLFEVKEVVKL